MTNLKVKVKSFSRVWLFATPWTLAYETPPSMEFSRQENWSGLPFPSPMHESESEVIQSCLTLSNPMDCSPPGSSVHGIFQARVLEWGAIAWKIPWTEEPGRLHAWGCEESNMTEWLHFHFHALEKEMATHSSVLAWRIPGTGEPGGLPSMGSHRVGHDWSD